MAPVTPVTQNQCSCPCPDKTEGVSPEVAKNQSTGDGKEGLTVFITAGPMLNIDTRALAYGEFRQRSGWQLNLRGTHLFERENETIMIGPMVNLNGGVLHGPNNESAGFFEVTAGFAMTVGGSTLLAFGGGYGYDHKGTQENTPTSTSTHDAVLQLNLMQTLAQVDKGLNPEDGTMDIGLSFDASFRGLAGNPSMNLGLSLSVGI
jgi:hypothetical protein